MASAPPQVMIVTVPGLGSQPTPTVCPNCRQSIVTSTSPSSGLVTWLSAGLCCLFGCWLGCCLIPFCVDGTQNIEHRCPSCKTYLGTHKRIG